MVSDFGQETMVVVYDAQEPSKVFIRLRQHLHFVWFELYAVKGDRIAYKFHMQSQERIFPR